MMRLTSLKKILAFTLALVVICVGFSAVAVWQGKTKSLSASFAQEAETVLTLQIGNPTMTVNGTQTKIDDDGTTPLLWEKELSCQSEPLLKLSAEMLCGTRKQRQFFSQ